MLQSKDVDTSIKIQLFLDSIKHYRLSSYLTITFDIKPSIEKQREKRKKTLSKRKKSQNSKIQDCVVNQAF